MQEAMKEDFNPRTSCEVRRFPPSADPTKHNFNPRTSCEVRQAAEIAQYEFCHFNPRTSCEVRPVERKNCIQNLKFQSTHLV